ncbi:MAG: site-2 protease family protein [Anaerolineales bacterium]
MSEPITERDELTPIIERYFDVEQLISGGGRYPFLKRYAGNLRIDSEEAYSAMSKELKSKGVTPLFFEEGGKQVIQLMPSLAKPRATNPWVNLLFFVVTVASVLMAGALYSYEGAPPESTGELIRLLSQNLDTGLSFAVSLLAILLAHEFGHYLVARHHKTAVTLPYFLPFPLSPFGTLGAFIQLKEPPRNKRILLDIGIAGPLAGLAVAIPVLLIGLSLSDISQIPSVLGPGDGISLEGNSLLYLLAKYAVHGGLLPAPESYGGLSPAVYWLKYFFTSLPIPFGGTDVFLHPVAWAGWAGLLVTALNLIPAGQLDGGHIIYGLLGDRARFVLPIVLVGLGLLGFVWSGWWLWVFLILMMGRSHAQPLDQITKLDANRMALAAFGLIVFVLVFTPMPLRVVVGGTP